VPTAFVEIRKKKHPQPPLPAARLNELGGGEDDEQGALYPLKLGILIQGKIGGLVAILKGEIDRPWQRLTKERK
jgi:hypothetical protein